MVAGKPAHASIARVFMTDHESRRRHPRVDTQQTVWVEGQDVRVEAEARNMSKGGMFVVSDAEAPSSPTIGSMLQIRFDDPHEGKVEVKMEVVWRDENTVTTKLGLRAVDSKGMAAFERVVNRYEGVQSAEGGADPDAEPTRPTLVPDPE
jgi:hypothetical protein